MLLTFSKDRFVDQIKDGLKIHTIREDPKNRWKKGMKIHFWRGNPRNAKSGAAPYQFLEGRCMGVQGIIILRADVSERQKHGLIVLVQSKKLKNERWLFDDQIEELAKNDGLTVDEFREWFVPESTKTFTGKIIHWTDRWYGYRNKT